MMAKHILARCSAAFNPDWTILVLLNNFILNYVLLSNILLNNQAGYRRNTIGWGIAWVYIGQWGWVCTRHVKSFTLFGSQPVTPFVIFHHGTDCFETTVSPLVYYKSQKEPLCLIASSKAKKENPR